MQTIQELELKIKELELSIKLIKDYADMAVLDCKKKSEMSDFDKGRLCQAELVQKTLPHFLK